MTTTAKQAHQTGDPNPSQAVDLDYPTLGRLVEAEARDLVEGAENVDAELQDLVRHAGTPAGASPGTGDEVPFSSDELIARLNGIGVVAYRLARHVRTLVEFRAIHLERRVDVEAGR